MENFVSIFITTILLIPLYGVLIWTYLDPEGSFLFGKRWMYKEEPELSQNVVSYARFSSMAVMVGIPVIIISYLVEVNILRLMPIVLIIVLIIGAIKILTREEDINK